MSEDTIEDAVLTHLRIVAHSKKALLQVAVRISEEYPAEASILISVISSLTSSADGLLGDTSVGPAPSAPKAKP